MRLGKENLNQLKIKINEILNELKFYYEVNSGNWDEENNAIFSQMVGTIILSFKKIESVEESLNNVSNFQKEIPELLEIEVEEVEVIVNFYYETFINKKGA
jgi:endonuclease III-like uncharacterized protein